MPVDIETHGRYAKIAQYVWDKSGGRIAEEKLRTLIGAEFDTIVETTIERHFRNLILARFFTFNMTALVAAKIDWNDYEEKIAEKKKLFAEKAAVEK